MDMLSRLEALDSKIRVAVVGAGSTGKGLFYQSHITPGFTCVALADIKLDKAVACAEFIGCDYRVVSDLDALNDAIRGGFVAICEDGDLLCRCESADVLLESTSSVLAGGQFALAALQHGKHVVMMNAEADLMFGPYLMEVAGSNGLVYTSCDGDQHGVIRRLVDDIRLWGFELVMAGNIKGYLDRYANPTSIIPEADKRDLDYKMCTSYTDGTKVCVEMALVANALGLDTAVPGMYGPRADDVLDALQLFDLEEIWKDRRPVVDYVLGATPKGGIFAIGYSESEYQKFMLGSFPSVLGDGPFYVFARPYHLCHVEAMGAIAEAVLDGEALLQPRHGFRTNIYAYAKKDLRKGEMLDGIGGYACYGLIENCSDNQETPGLPICLADDVKLVRDVPKDEKIAMADISYDASAPQFRLFEEALRASAALEPANSEVVG